MAPEAAQCEQQGVDEGAGAALEAARRPDARQPPQEQPKIQAADLQEQALEDVAVSAQVHAAHAPGLVEMGVGTFAPFAAPAQQPLPARAAAARRVGRPGVRKVIAALIVRLKANETVGSVRPPGASA